MRASLARTFLSVVHSRKGESEREAGDVADGLCVFLSAVSTVERAAALSSYSRGPGSALESAARRGSSASTAGLPGDLGVEGVRCPEATLVDCLVTRLSSEAEWERLWSGCVVFPFLPFLFPFPLRPRLPSFVRWGVVSPAGVRVADALELLHPILPERTPSPCQCCSNAHTHTHSLSLNESSCAGGKGKEGRAASASPKGKRALLHSGGRKEEGKKMDESSMERGGQPDKKHEEEERLSSSNGHSLPASFSFSDPFTVGTPCCCCCC